MKLEKNNYAILGVFFLVLIILVAVSSNQMKNTKQPDVETEKTESVQTQQTPPAPENSVQQNTQNNQVQPPPQYQEFSSGNPQVQSPQNNINPQDEYNKFVSLGNSYLGQNKYNEAIKEFYNAYNTNVDNYSKSMAMTLIAECYEKAQSYTYALQYYQYALNLNPANPMIEVSIAKIKEKRGDTSEATADWENILKKYPNDQYAASEAKAALDNIARTHPPQTPAQSSEQTK